MSTIQAPDRGLSFSLSMFQGITAVFKKPTAKVLASRQIEDYQRLLLNSEASAAYHTKMAEYYREGISRLGKFR